MSEWISVEDQYPELGKKVLVFSSGRDVYTGWVNSSGTFTVLSGAHGAIASYIITHWMPLPESPKPEGPFWIISSGGLPKIVFNQCYQASSVEEKLELIQDATSVEADRTRSVVDWLNEIWSKYDHRKKNE